jgi:hypothetical protein
MIRYSKEEREQRAAVRAMEDGKRREAASQRSKPPRPIAKGQRQPRVHDHGYLAWLRRAPCIAGLIEGGCQGPVQACHLRMSIPAAPTPGSPTRPTTPSPGQAASTTTSRTSTAPQRPPSSGASVLIPSISVVASTPRSALARCRRPPSSDTSSKQGCSSRWRPALRASCYGPVMRLLAPLLCPCYAPVISLFGRNLSLLRCSGNLTADSA